MRWGTSRGAKPHAQALPGAARRQQQGSYDEGFAEFHWARVKLYSEMRLVQRASGTKSGRGRVAPSGTAPTARSVRMVRRDPNEG